MGFLKGILGSLFDSVIGGIVRAWESSKRDATNIEKGADKVVKERLKDEAEKAKEANEAQDDIRRSSDDDIDNWMRRPKDRH